MKKKMITGMCLMACLAIFNMNTQASYAAENTSASAETTTENQTTEDTVESEDTGAYATFEDINDNSVFMKQSQRGYCTLTSNVMMIRRAKMLLGDDDWESVTESSVAAVGRISSGMLWSFTYDDVSVAYKTVASVDELKDMLSNHPEGVVAYDSYTPHAILLTDYDEETDTFYCMEPAQGYPEGRIPATQALISVQNVNSVWYVTSPESLKLADDTEKTAEDDDDDVFVNQLIENKLFDKTDLVVNNRR